MTLTDDLTRTAALLSAGWPIQHLNRARRVAQEQRKMASKTNPNQIADERAKAEKAAKYREACEEARQMRGYEVRTDVIRGTALHETTDQIDSWRVWWDRCKQIGEVA